VKVDGKGAGSKRWPCRGRCKKLLGTLESPPSPKLFFPVPSSGDWARFPPPMVLPPMASGIERSCSCPMVWSIAAPIVAATVRSLGLFPDPGLVASLFGGPTYVNPASALRCRRQEHRPSSGLRAIFLHPPWAAKPPWTVHRPWWNRRVTKHPCHSWRARLTPRQRPLRGARQI